MTAKKTTKPKATSRAGHIRCVRMIPKENAGRTFCGREPDVQENPFFSPDGAVIAGLVGIEQDGQRLETCPECRKVIVQALTGKIPVLKAAAA